MSFIGTTQCKTCRKQTRIKLKFNQYQYDGIESMWPILESGFWRGECCDQDLRVPITQAEIEAFKPKFEKPATPNISEQHMDWRKKESNRNLEKAVRTGRAHGKNINNLRSKFKNGTWEYEYIK